MYTKGIYTISESFKYLLFIIITWKTAQVKPRMTFNKIIFIASIVPSVGCACVQAHTFQFVYIIMHFEDRYCASAFSLYKFMQFILIMWSCFYIHYIYICIRSVFMFLFRIIKRQRQLAVSIARFTIEQC